MLYCQVYHYIYPPVELESTDEPIEGTIIFTPDIRRGEVWIENNTVVPAVPIRCDVVNGVMRFGGRDGSRFAKLMAGGPGVNPGKVHWRVSFHDMHMGEDYFKINPFIFEAVPNTTINLAEVTPVSGYTPEGIIQGPKGEPGGAATTFYGDEEPIGPLEGDTWFIPGKNGLPDEIRLYMGGEWVTIVSEEYWKIVDDKLAQSEFDLTDPEGKLAKAREEANAALDELDGKLAEASQAISDTKFDIYDPEGRLTKELTASRATIEELKENLKMARENVDAAMFDINDPEGKLAKAAEKAQADLQTLDQKLYGSDGSLTLLSEKTQEAWNKAVAAGNANVVDVVYEYQQSNSDTVVPTGVWTLDPPTKDSTKFLWRRETLKYGNGDVEIRPPYPITGPKGERGAVGATGGRGLQGLQGPAGDQGIKGPAGEDGVSSYTHIAYADTSTGGGFSQNPDGKDYMGVYVDDIPEDSSTPSKYHWSLIKGADGAKGVAGAKGADGRTPYFHTAWANNITGTSGFSITDSIGKTHIGTYTDYVEDDSTDPSKYNWILVKGEKGDAGSSGSDGVGVSKTVINYQLGTSATTAPTGTWYTNVPSAKAGDYVWTRVVWTYTDGSSKTSYSVAMIGEKGEQGPQGATGARGLQGIQGVKGDQGIKGADGANGKPSYTHIAYADTASGGGFSQDPSNKAYIGIYVDDIATDSTTASKYKWSLIKGADGAKGVAGAKGADGRTPYFHTAWANNSTGTSGFSTTVSAGKLYIGTYTDFVEADSTTASKYNWVLIKGEKGDQGPQGTTGAKGATGATGTTGPTGAKGDKGATGAKGDQGVSLTAIIPYFILATSTPAKPTVASPSGWTTTEPGYRVNYNLYRSDKVVFSDNSFSWTAVTLVQSYQVAVQALESANGKNTINTSTATTPSKNGTTVGDVWWRVDSSNNVLAQWMWNGSSWRAQQIESEVIASLDVNKLTVSSSARMKEAVIDKIWADGIVAKTITTSRLAVSGGNIYPDPKFEDPKWPATVSGKGDILTGGISLNATGSQVGVYYQPDGAYDTSMQAEPGAKYRMTAHLRFGGNAQITSLAIYARYKKPDGVKAATFLGSFDRFPTDGQAHASYTYNDIGIDLPIDSLDMAPGRYFTIGFFLNAHNTAGNVEIRDIRITRKAGTTYIDDGAITTDKVAANSIVSTKIDSKAVTTDKLDSEAVTTIKLDAEAVTTEKLDTGAVTTVKLDAGAVTADKIQAEQATIDKLWTSGIAAKSVTANRVLISNNGNMLPDIPVYAEAPTKPEPNPYPRPFGLNTGHPSIWVQGRTNATIVHPINLVAGQKYKFSFRANASVNGTRHYWQLQKANSEKLVGGGVSAKVGSSTTSYVISNQIINTSLGSFESIFEALVTGTVFLHVLANHPNGTANDTGYQWFRDLRLEKLTGATLIEDGAITTNKIDTLDITASKFTMEQGFVKTAHIHSLDAGKISAGTININRIPSITTAKLANGAVNVDKLGNTVLADGLGKWNQSILVSPTIIRWKKGSATIGTVSADGLRFYSDTGVAISRLINGKARYSSSNIVDSLNVILDGPTSLFSVGFPDTRPNPPVPNRAWFEVHNQGDGQLKLGGTDYGGIRTVGDVVISLNATHGTVLQLFDHVNYLTDIINHFVFNGSTPNKNFRLPQLPLMKYPVTWE